MKVKKIAIFALAINVEIIVALLSVFGISVRRVGTAPAVGITIVAIMFVGMFLAGISVHIIARFALAINVEIIVALLSVFGISVRRVGTAPTIRIVLAMAMATLRGELADW